MPAKKAPPRERAIDAEKLARNVEGQIARQRMRLEAAIKRSKASPAKANAMRAEFNNEVAQVRSKLQAALADGIVTRSEGRSVLLAAAQLGRKKPT